MTTSRRPAHVAVRSGELHLTTFGTRTVLSIDEAHVLVDDLREALRSAEFHEARQLLRDEDEIRTAADVREGL